MTRSSGKRWLRTLALFLLLLAAARFTDCSPALWSTRLALTHPVTGKPIDVSCPPPDAWPWNLFA